ncbi:MAG: metallophosphoesterase [Planctomycetota bacterium]
MPTRRIFIGDLQGCREEFEALLEAVRFDPAEDALHPVGDLVNRGPDSVGCLRLCRDLGAMPVLGNHDVHLLRQAADPGLRGSRRTLEAVRADAEGDALLDWLRARPYALGWQDVLAVHAAISPRWAEPLDVLAGRDPLALEPDTEFAVRARYCDAGGALPESDWPEPGPPFVPWDEHWRARPNERRTVVFGHWARRGLVQLERTVGLDTGCVYGGTLTAWIPEERRVVSVPARRVWAPKGD